MQHNSLTLRSIILGTALGAGSVGNSSEPQQPAAAPAEDTTDVVTNTAISSQQAEQAPILPAVAHPQLPITPLVLTGKAYSSGALSDLTYQRMSAGQELMSQLLELRQVTTPEMLTLSVAEQKQKIFLAISEVQALEAKITEATDDKQFLSAVQTVLEGLADFYGGLERFEAPVQQKALDVLLTIEHAIAQNDQTLDLATSRSSLQEVTTRSYVLAEGMKGEEPFLLQKDRAGVTVLDHVHHLLQKDRSPAAILLALDIVNDLYNPDIAGFQTSYPHCPSGGIHNFVLRSSPGEYTRQVVELFLDGKTTFVTGKVCELDRDAMSEEHLTRRSASGTIFQSSLIKYGARNNPRRTAEELQRGLSVSEIEELASDYFGLHYKWLQGTRAVAYLLEREPSAPVFGALFNFENSGPNRGHFILYTHAKKERLYFLDSNGNYGLHPHGWSIEKAAEGEAPKWHWGDCSDAGPNPLPAGMLPLLLPARGGTRRFWFSGEGDLPAPGFIRHFPERRLEDWNSGRFSIEAAELDRTNARFLAPIELIQEYFKPAEPPAQSPIRSILYKIALGIGAWFVISKVIDRIHKRKQKPVLPADQTSEQASDEHP